VELLAALRISSAVGRGRAASSIIHAVMVLYAATARTLRAVRHVQAVATTSMLLPTLLLTVSLTLLLNLFCDDN